MSLLDDAKAKLVPLIDDAKIEAKPFWHALRYCFVWLAWAALVPLVALGSWLSDAAKKIKPELPPQG